MYVCNQKIYDLRVNNQAIYIKQLLLRERSENKREKYQTLWKINNFEIKVFTCIPCTSAVSA